MQQVGTSTAHELASTMQQPASGYASGGCRGSSGASSIKLFGRWAVDLSAGGALSLRDHRHVIAAQRPRELVLHRKIHDEPQSLAHGKARLARDHFNVTHRAFDTVGITQHGRESLAKATRRMASGPETPLTSKLGDGVATTLDTWIRELNAPDATADEGGAAPTGEASHSVTR